VTNNKYKIYATKTIHYEAVVEAVTFAEAESISDELITDDFDQINTDFKIEYIVLEST